MQTSRDLIKKKKKSKQVQSRGCKALCCSCRLSVSSSSSSEEAESLSSSDRFQTISSIAHAMVQERLDQMIRERQEARSVRQQQQQQTRRNETTTTTTTTTSNTKFVVMVAMEKSSYDPREDFRESMEKMIVANRIHEAKNLRRLLNYYLTMNSEEFHGVILEVFHEVCTDLFLYGKRH